MIKTALGKLAMSTEEDFDKLYGQLYEAIVLLEEHFAFEDKLMSSQAHFNAVGHSLAHNHLMQTIHSHINGASAPGTILALRNVISLIDKFVSEHINLEDYLRKSML